MRKKILFSVGWRMGRAGEPVRLGGDWSSGGNREGETLWPLLSVIFNIFFSANPSQDDADLVLGGMLLARGAANIADQLFGWHTGGWGGGFLAHLHSAWGYNEPEIHSTSNHQFGPIGADAGQVTEIGHVQAQAAFKACSQAKIAMLNGSFSAAC